MEMKDKLRYMLWLTIVFVYNFMTLCPIYNSVSKRINIDAWHNTCFLIVRYFISFAAAAFYYMRCKTGISFDVKFIIKTHEVFGDLSTDEIGQNYPQSTVT